VINCVNVETAKYFGDALASNFQLRYKSLIDQQYWRLSHFKGMEYDQYDTPAASYLVWQDQDGVVRGSVRVTPTDRPYMLQEIWPDMVKGVELPSSLSVWEATRFCVDPELKKPERRRIVAELVLGFLEFGLKNDIKQMIGVMPKQLWESCFIKNGWEIEYIGTEKTFDDGSKIMAGLMPISIEMLQRVRQKTLIKHPIINANLTEISKTNILHGIDFKEAA